MVEIRSHGYPEWKGICHDSLSSVRCSVFSVQCSVFSVQCSVFGKKPLASHSFVEGTNKFKSMSLLNTEH
jgi:hypothetical protein